MAKVGCAVGSNGVARSVNALLLGCIVFGSIGVANARLEVVGFPATNAVLVRV